MVNNLKNNNLISETKLNLSLEPENFENIKFLAYNFIDNKDYDGALNFGKWLDGELKIYKIENNNQLYYFRILEYWVLRLKLFGFSSLGTNETTDLLKKSAVKILINQLDLKRAIYSFLNYYGSDDLILDYSKDFSSALSVNQEILGISQEFITKLNFKPTVENWLKEYSTVLTNQLNGLKVSPGAFNILKFIDNSSYTKYLRDDEVEVLKDLLDLYNWLQNPIASTQEVRASQTFEYTNTQRLELPKEISEPVKNPPVVPPVVPAPKIALNFKDTEENAKVNVQDIVKKRVNTEVKNEGPGLYFGSNPAVSGQGTAGSGSKLTSPSLSLERRGMDAKVQGPDIDKKLQELDSRKKTKKQE